MTGGRRMKSDSERAAIHERVRKALGGMAELVEAIKPSHVEMMDYEERDLLEAEMQLLASLTKDCRKRAHYTEMAAKVARSEWGACLPI